MDPTILAAVTGVAGVIVGAIIGGVFALKAAKRQIEVMLVQARGNVNERLYNQSLEIMRFFAENPELVLWSWSRFKWRNNLRRFNPGGRLILSMGITLVL